MVWLAAPVAALEPGGQALTLADLAARATPHQQRQAKVVVVVVALLAELRVAAAAEQVQSELPQYRLPAATAARGRRQLLADRLSLTLAAAAAAQASP